MTFAPEFPGNGVTEMSRLKLRHQIRWFYLPLRCHTGDLNQRLVADIPQHANAGAKQPWLLLVGIEEKERAGHQGIRAEFHD